MAAAGGRHFGSSVLGLLLACMAFLTLASTAVAAGPATFTVKPAAGSTATTTVIAVVARADDVATVTAGALYVDGALASNQWYFPIGHWDGNGCESEWVVDDYTVSESNAQLTLADGSHDASYTVTNAAGQTSLYEWSFSVGAPPLIEQHGPTGIVKTATPVISTKVTDNGTDPLVLTMTVDGITVGAEFETETALFQYQPDTMNEGTHTVVVTAEDVLGFSSTKTWQFTVRVRAHMAFSGFTPAAGSVVTAINPPMRVDADEQYAAVTSAVATLNGSAVPVGVSWPIGHWVESGCEMDWVVDDPTVARASINMPLEDGENTVSVRFLNADGFSDETTWSFDIAAPPVLSSPLPAPRSDVATLSPTISAALADNDASLEQVELRLDGMAIPATVTLDGVSAVAPKLKDDTTHTVSISATDAAGLNDTLEWTFRVEVQPDMAVGPCTDCHAQAEHPMSNCSNCHDPARSGHGGGVTRPISSCNCHGGGQHTPYVYWMDQCTHCHQPPQYEPYVRNHPVPLESAHTYDVALHGDRCTECHNRSLTREHNKYKDGSGSSLHCATCHGEGASQRVRDAIAAGNTDCYACHDDHDHRAALLDGIEAGDGNYCLDCHDADLVWEHGAKETSKQYGSRFCDSCHPAGRPWSAPIAWDRSCETPECHGEGSAHPVHSTYCQGCHQNENTDFSVKQTDFSGASVTKTKCLSCHGTGITSFGSYKKGRRWYTAAHLSHDATSECATCHFWGPRRTEFYTHTVTGPYGGFASVDSTSPTAARAHSVHTGGSWPRDIELAPYFYCGNCHRSAGCGSCHEVAAMPVAHAAHGTQATETVMVIRGASSFTAPKQAPVAEVRSCTAAACHGGPATTVPSCTSSCHVERTEKHW